MKNVLQCYINVIPGGFRKLMCNNCCYEVQRICYTIYAQEDENEDDGRWAFLLCKRPVGPIGPNRRQLKWFPVGGQNGR